LVKIKCLSYWGVAENISCFRDVVEGIHKSSLWSGNLEKAEQGKG
jgi:hypothetical protein